MPDSVESRLLRLEERTARIDQRQEDLAREVGTLTPLVREVVTLAGQVAALAGDFHDLNETVRQIKRGLDDRDRQSTEERRSVRVALIGLIAVILAALIAAGATIIAAGPG